MYLAGPPISQVYSQSATCAIKDGVTEPLYSVGAEVFNANATVRKVGAGRVQAIVATGNEAPMLGLIGFWDQMLQTSADVQFAEDGVTRFVPTANADIVYEDQALTRPILHPHGKPLGATAPYFGREPTLATQDDTFPRYEVYRATTEVWVTTTSYAYARCETCTGGVANVGWSRDYVGYRAERVAASAFALADVVVDTTGETQADTGPVADAGADASTSAPPTSLPSPSPSPGPSPTSGGGAQAPNGPGASVNQASPSAASPTSNAETTSTTQVHSSCSVGRTSHPGKPLPGFVAALAVLVAALRRRRAEAGGATRAA
jgi:MYXO-CTERM domain-containing protein